VTEPTPARANNLTLPGLDHGFFGRRGGVSTGIYTSLNCGFGSGDDPAHVAQNRARAAACLSAPGHGFATPHQVHGTDVIHVTEVWAPKSGPKADGVVTDRPGIALGVLSADCAPVLFLDTEARVIGAAHAGWRGALAGVTDRTIAAMCALGADRARIRAAVGPCIGPTSYEVGAEFQAAFAAGDPDSGRFFRPGARADKFFFDLPAYVGARLARAGIGSVELLGHCTYDRSDEYFSFRRTTHRGEADYGRDLSAIILHD